MPGAEHGAPLRPRQRPPEEEDPDGRGAAVDLLVPAAGTVLLWILCDLDFGQLLVPCCSVPSVALPRLGNAMHWGQTVPVGQELDCLEVLQGILPHSTYKNFRFESKSQLLTWLSPSWGPGSWSLWKLLHWPKFQKFISWAYSISSYYAHLVQLSLLQRIRNECWNGFCLQGECLVRAE